MTVYNWNGLNQKKVLAILPCIRSFIVLLVTLLISGCNKKTKTAVEKATVSQFLENDIYSFKVRPESKDGQQGPESDESESIQTTMIIPSKPGQPNALNITHDSVLSLNGPNQNKVHTMLPLTQFSIIPLVTH